MSRAFEGDEWKQCAEAPKATSIPRHRAQVQLNRDYEQGLISRAEWSLKFNELSDVARWGAGGKLK